MERIRKQMATQLADFDTMKKALMKDLQDRCEKVRGCCSETLWLSRTDSAAGGRA